jgi:flagellar capping protein FliD
MTRILLLFICVLLTFSTNLFSQEEVDVFKRIFTYTDSLSKAPQKGVVSDDITGILATLDKDNPGAFFAKTGELIKAGKFNDASLVYSIGYYRLEYFEVTNPDYQPSERDTAVVAANPFNAQYIDLILRSDIDNFIKILDRTKNWLTNNDYQFNSKTKDPEKYNEYITHLDTLISDLTANKEKHQAQWATQLTEIRKAIQEMGKSKQTPASKSEKKTKKNP